MDANKGKKTVAKNTLILYLRTIIIMLVSLYTSRVILSVLGVSDFGIYNVVGGLVAMFSIVSGSLATAISRFLTFELGKGESSRLKQIFSTSIIIQIMISLIIILLGTPIGLWFIYSYMNIPPDRMDAASIVLICSIISFAINLISVPYNAVIIAHEKMSAFAYISILDVSLKLGIVFLLYILPWDNLMAYSILLVIESAIIRIVYGIYCHRHFKETHAKAVFDKRLLLEMAQFAGWGFLSNSAYMLNTQGINILMNLFFGITINAARGITVHVETALVKFASDFTTAINPQIIKSYATKELSYTYSLINIGAKYSYFLIFILALPIIIETDYILSIWLKEVPAHTATFVRLSIIGTMIDRLGYSGYTACMATGNIRLYTICISSVGFLVFPISYISFKLGAPAESTYYIYAIIYILVTITRLHLMKRLLNYPISSFIKHVIQPIVTTTLIAIILPLLIRTITPVFFMKDTIIIIACIISTIATIYIFGIETSERKAILKKMHSLRNKSIMTSNKHLHEE